MSEARRRVLGRLIAATANDDQQDAMAIERMLKNFKEAEALVDLFCDLKRDPERARKLHPTVLFMVVDMANRTFRNLLRTAIEQMPEDDS